MGNKYTFFLVLLSVSLLTSCFSKKAEVPVASVSTDLKAIYESDTLRVATMYGATSYFLFRDELMGFDYEMANNLAQHLNVNLKISIAQNEMEMAQWLHERKVDVVAYNIVETKEFKKLFHFVLPQTDSYQVLVQNRYGNTLSDVTQLAGKTVYVKANSIFHHRLKALNDEIGGKINIVIAADSLSNEDLIEMVAENKIQYTLAYHNTAMIYKSYYNRLNIHMSVGFDQHNGWLVRAESSNLEKAINKWEKLPETEQVHTTLFDKYWDKSPYFIMRQVIIPKGSISPFDHLFKKYAPVIGWDWRLLAALAFHESRFDTSQRSRMGAAGIMQLMPRTASNFGLSRHTIYDPESNIEAGVQYIKSLDMAFRRIENKAERIKFILAAYNSGPAHVIDAIALSRKFGKNSKVWFGSVEYYFLKKNEPEFYNDPVVKYGFYRGNVTARYVRSTLGTYEKYKRRK